MVDENLGNRIKSLPISSAGVDKWFNMRHLLNNYVVATNVISPTEAEKFKFDLAGLFKIKFEMKEELILPHILVNGYNSSTEYNGDRLEFKFLDYGSLQTFISRNE